MKDELLKLAEDALEILRKASRGIRHLPGDEPEPGIRSGNYWETLRDKAAKALELLPDLHERKSYTVSTELSLYAVERMTEAAVIRKYVVAGKLEHGRIFEEAAELGIMDRDLAAYLSRMFRYRADMYYRTGIGTRELSTKLRKLAETLWALLALDENGPKTK